MKKLSLSKTTITLGIVTLLVIAFVFGYFFGRKSVINTQIEQNGAVITTEKRREAAPPVQQTQTESESFPIDLNRATAVQLETLPGIGKTLAERIVAYREQYGDFKTVSQLVGVEGIGEGKLAQMEPYLTVR